jgi:hypothetical protein
MTGTTLSDDFPVLPGAVQETFGGTVDVWVAKDPLGEDVPPLEIMFTITHPREGVFSVQTAEEAQNEGLVNAPYIPFFDRVHNAAQFEVSLTNNTLVPIDDLTRVVMTWTWTEKNLHGATNWLETPNPCGPPPIGEADDNWWCGLYIDREIDYPIELYRDSAPDRRGDCNRIVLDSSGNYLTGDPKPCLVSAGGDPFDPQEDIPKEHCTTYEPPYEEAICGLLWWDVRDEHTDLYIGAEQTITLPQVPYNILHSGIIDFRIIVEHGEPRNWSEVTHEDFQLKIPITQMVQEADPENDIPEPGFRDTRLESVIFWLVYFETSEGRWEHPDIIANSASTVTPPDEPESLSTDFLRTSPYCDGNNNNVEDNEKPDVEWNGTWPAVQNTWRERGILSFNHCSPNFPDNQPEGDIDTHQATLMTYTFLNGFLDRERQYGPVGYAGFAFSTTNFEYMTYTHDLWTHNGLCTGLGSYQDAWESDLAIIGSDTFSNRLTWMDGYLNCLLDEDVVHSKALQVRDTYNRLMPRIRQGMDNFVLQRDNADFYPVMGALTYKAANRPRLQPSGECVKDEDDPTKCKFTSVSTFVGGFATAYCPAHIRQTDVESAYDGIPNIYCGLPYDNFIDELRNNYTPSLRTTILRPVLWAEGSGYRWVSLSLQIGQYPLLDAEENVITQFMGRNIPR